MEAKMRYLLNKDRINNLQIIGLPELEEKGKGELQVVREIIADFPTLWKQVAVHIQEAKRVSKNGFNGTTPRHIMIQMAKTKREMDTLNL